MMSKKGLLLFLCLLWLTACGNEQAAEDKASNEQASVEEETSDKDSMGYSESKEDSAHTQRKIIKHAAITQKVTDLEPALSSVQQLINQSGGYIESSAIHEYNDMRRQASYLLRVPETSFLSIIDSLQVIGKNTSITQKGEDVTITIL